MSERPKTRENEIESIIKKQQHADIIEFQLEKFEEQLRITSIKTVATHKDVANYATWLDVLYRYKRLTEVEYLELKAALQQRKAEIDASENGDL